MTLAQLRSFSGWVLVVGAIAALVGNTASGVLFPDSSNPAYSTTPLFVPLNLLGAVGAGLLLLGLPGLYASHRLELRVSGFVGIVLISITAMMFGIFLGLFTAIVQPFVAVQAPQLMAAQPPVALLVFFVLGTLVEVVGSLLLALPMLRGSMRPRWAGYVLVVSAVLAAVSFFLNGPGSATNALTIALNIAPAALLVLVLGWLGYDLVTAPVAVTAEPAMEDAELARRAS